MASSRPTLNDRTRTFLELAGLTMVTVGIHQVYSPAALIFAGAALISVAQGMARDR